MSQPHYAPEFKILVDGEPIPASLRSAITSISFQSGLEAIDRLEIAIANENLQWLNHSILKLDRVVSLLLGYAPDPLAQVFVGEIVGHNASFPSTGVPVLTIVSQDKRHRMQKGNRSRWFAVSIPNFTNKPVPDPVVASLIGAEYGLIPITDPISASLAVLLSGASTAIAYAAKDVQKVIRKETGESDYDLLRHIAAENGWEMVVEHDGALGGALLRFVSMAGQLLPEVTLTYGKNLIEFSPRISTVGEVAAVAVSVWQPDLKATLMISVSWDWDQQSLTLRIQPVNGSMPSTRESGATMLLDSPVTQSNAASVILGKLLPRLNRRQTGSGSTIGNAGIKAGAVLNIEGLGEIFGGLYRVTSVTQSLDTGGWRTSFEVRKEIWFGAIPDGEQSTAPFRLTA